MQRHGNGSSTSRLQNQTQMLSESQQMKHQRSTLTRQNHSQRTFETANNSAVNSFNTTKNLSYQLAMNQIESQMAKNSSHILAQNKAPLPPQTQREKKRVPLGPSAVKHSQHGSNQAAMHTTRNHIKTSLKIQTSHGASYGASHGAANGATQVSGYAQ